MSAEVVKKRGRPKKVVADTTEFELLETVSKTSARASSNLTKTAAAKATSKPAKTPAKPKAVKPAKASLKTVTKKDDLVAGLTKPIGEKETHSAIKQVAPKPVSPTKKASASVIEKIESKEKTITSTKLPNSPVSTPIAILSDPPKSSAKAPSSLKVKKDVLQQNAPLAAATTYETVSTVTPATSKILSKVRELSQKTSISAQVSTPKPSEPSTISPAPKTSTKSMSSAELPKSVKPTSPNTIVKTNPEWKIPVPALSKPVVDAKSRHKTQTPPPSVNAKPKPAPKARIPIAALNKEIVSNISARAGARPNPAGSGGLPPGYKPAARKVTMTIVALPIAIVTSYVLYQRLVLGQDKKELFNPGLTAAETAEGKTARMKASIVNLTSEIPNTTGHTSTAARLAEREPLSKTLPVASEPSTATATHNTKTS